MAACGGAPSSTASHSPTASPAQASAASPSSSAGSTGVATPLHCTKVVPSGDNLVIGTVVGDPTVVVRDIQDPANARSICTLDATALSPQFMSSQAMAYETADNQIIKVQFATVPPTIVAQYHSGTGSGQYAVSPNGQSITYLDGNAWHLTGPSGDKTLTTLPAVPARGVNPDEDDSYLSFSLDGNYIALVSTFHTGGTGETAPDQIRRANDGALVYSASGMTMGVWSSVPSALFFRDSNGVMKRWDPNGVSNMLTLRWIRPRSSPDGRWIAYTYRTSDGLGAVGFYSLQGNRVSNTTPPGRSGVVFLNNDLVWYLGEQACSTCLGGAPKATGVAYIYSIAGASEISSRLTTVLDVWPRSTPPGVG
jgi:hypothetical protein